MSERAGELKTVTELDRIRMVGSAYRKTGRRVVLVPLGDSVHAGHLALVRAAAAVRGGVVVVAAGVGGEGASASDVLTRAGADYLWLYEAPAPRIVVQAPDHGLEDVSAALTRVLGLIGAVGPSDVVMGERDYELLLAVSQAVHDLHLNVRVQGVPTVRMPSGLAIAGHNTDVAADSREAATALSAALTAGAHAAEAGADKVLEVAGAVLAAAGVEPEYLTVRGRDLGPAPAEGDARLLVAADIGGVRLIDNVGLPLGIGFRNIEAG